MPAPADHDEALTAVDAAWLRMDRPTNLMMICGLMRFADRVDLHALREIVRTRLLCFHRFRQRVACAQDDPHWATDPHLDVDWHVRHIAPAGEALEDTMSELASTALDPGKPMWQFHLIDLPAGSAVVLRIHHCYADGFALLHAVDAICDLDPARPRVPPCDVAAPAPPRSSWERMLGPLSETAGDALRTTLAVAAGGTGLLAHPLRALDYALSGADLLYQAGVIANMAPDAATRLKGELGVMKRVAWAAPLPLHDVKAVAGALACSVNDVLVACVAGALRAYLLEQGDRLDTGPVRALVPVNLRPPGPPTQLGNRFGLVFLDLPAGCADPVERVLETHRRMDVLKHSHQPLVALGVLAGIGKAPRAIRERVLDVLAANASVVLTNVHGQDEARFLAGKRITHQMFWVPQSGGIGVGASVLSYDGQVNFGLVTDALRVPDPASITRRFAGEFETLLLATLMLPWPAAPARGRATAHAQ
jgi:WS/DGAT/MGAT family acyltransferase